MKNIWLLIFVLLLIGCKDPCDGSEPTDFFRFKMIDKDTGNDLFFGSQAVFDPKKLEVSSAYPLDIGTDNDVFNYRVRVLKGNILQTVLSAEVEEMYFEFEDGDIDTISAAYIQFEKCGALELRNITYNNVLICQICPVDSVHQIVK